jgi:uncharacterized membrane protein
MFTETLKKEWYVVILLIIPFGVSAYYWNDLPDLVPTHFNIQGEANDWGPKWVNAIMFPAIGLATYFSLIFLPFIDPKKRIESRQKPIAAIRVLLSLFMVGLYAFVMAKSLGSELNFGSYLNAGIGLLILIIGNYMASLKQNYFIGVKTPWTLESEEVWKRTHRITSKIWTVGGLILMISSLLMAHAILYWSLFGIVISILVLYPIIYSYVIFQRIDAAS